MAKIIHLLLMIFIFQERFFNAFGDDNLFPYFAQLKIPSSNSTHNETIVCGSSLIHPEWILSAAHCFLIKDVLIIDPSAVTVYMGSIKKFDESSEINNITNYILHPDYWARLENDMFVECLNDIALAKLLTPYVLTKNVQIIVLPNNSTPVMNHGTIIGLGGTRFYPPLFPDKVQHVRVGIKQREELTNPNLIPKSDTLFFSEGNINDGPYAYEGDDGGPFSSYIHGVPVLLGVITQWRNDTDNYLEQTAYESVEKHLDFITRFVSVVHFDIKQIPRPQKERTSGSATVQVFKNIISLLLLVYLNT